MCPGDMCPSLIFCEASICLNIISFLFHHFLSPSILFLSTLSLSLSCLQLFPSLSLPYTHTHTHTHTHRHLPHRSIDSALDLLLLSLSRFAHSNSYSNSQPIPGALYDLESTTLFTQPCSASIQSRQEIKSCNQSVKNQYMSMLMLLSF